MKFSCVRENIEPVISITEKFVGKNINLPVLSNLLLEVDKNIIKISATNLEYAIQAKISGKIDKAGEICVPARIFSSLIQSIKDDKITLEDKQGSLFINTDNYHTRINGLKSEDFPLIPKSKKDFVFFVDPIVLKQGMEKVISSVSASEFKPELTGILFSLQGKELKLVSTDTFRLTEQRLILSEKTKPESVQFIVPQRVSQEIIRVLERLGEGRLEISVGDNQVFFEGDSFRVVSRLLDGRFPEYEIIIPKSFKTSCFFSADKLREVVRASSIFSSRLQDVSLELSGREMAISSSSPEVGEYKTAIPISLTGENASVSFNYRYLLDGLSSLDEEECFLGLNPNGAPALLRNKTDPSFLCVLMPIKTA